MTVIAANKEMMCSDSQVTVPNKGIVYPATKIIRIGPRIYGASGDGGDCSRFLEWAKKDFKGSEPKWREAAGNEDAVLALVLDAHGIYVWCVGDPEPELVNADYFAVGSGGKVARAAMKLGLDPVAAVELCFEIDRYWCGPPVQCLRLDGK